MDDHLVMQKVKAGEVDQLGLLFEKYRRALFGFFFNRSQDTALSEDLVQNVFMRILRYRHLYKDSGDFKAWLFQIARNVLFDHHKKKRLPTSDSIDDWQDQLVDKNHIRSQEMIQKEELQELRKALDQLPSEKRDVLIMSKLQGMSYKDIAQQLNCTEGNVKVKVFRALKSLKAIYQTKGR